MTSPTVACSSHSWRRRKNSARTNCATLPNATKASHRCIRPGHPSDSLQTNNLPNRSPSVAKPLKRHFPASLSSVRAGVDKCVPLPVSAVRADIGPIESTCIFANSSRRHRTHRLLSRSGLPPSKTIHQLVFTCPTLHNETVALTAWANSG